VLTTGRGLSSNNSFYLGSPALVQRPGVVAALFAALSEADDHVRHNRAETARFVAEFTGLPLATALRFIERRTSGPIVALRPQDVADQQRDADAFAQAGLIPRPVHVADAVRSPASARSR